MLEIDGASGEGGGQILRSAVALSMITGKPFRVSRIRHNRKSGGLKRQHLTAIQAAAQVCGATLIGAELHSTELEFRPGSVVSGDFQFSIGSAGSTTLVLQTVLPALWSRSDAPAANNHWSFDEPKTDELTRHVTIEGGTHNPFAPPYDFLLHAYVPLINRMGPTISLRLDRHGFFPRGGGQIVATISPAHRLKGISLRSRGALRSKRATALLAGLPEHIGDRELDVVRRLLGWHRDELQLELLDQDRGPGNVLLIELEYDFVTEVFVAFGEKGVPAERVARTVVREVKQYLTSNAVVGEYLADQLLLPMALAGEGEFCSGPLSLHATTQLNLIPLFLDVRFEVTETDGQTIVSVGSA